MKMKKALLVLIIFLASFQLLNGQQPILHDVIGKANCEEMLARLDGLYFVLNQRPNFSAYIVTYGNKNNYLEKYQREGFFQTAIGHRKMNDRVFLIQGKDENEIKTEIWIVPRETEKPGFEEEKWDYSLPEIERPVKFFETIWENYDPCPSFGGEALYSRLLGANPDFRGNIVIYEKSARKLQEAKKDLIAQLVTQDKIPLKRLKFYLIQSKTEPNQELWLLPKKKK